MSTTTGAGRTSNWRFWCGVALLAIGVVAHDSAAQAQTQSSNDELRIVPLVRGHEVLVSFELPEAYTSEIRDSIASGLQTTFTYDLELRQDVAFWADRTVATAIVSISNQYDSLTEQHSLARTVDGLVVDAMVTRDEDVVKQWLTTFSRLSLCDTSRLEPNRDYYVRVRARGRPQMGSLLAWASNAVTGQAKFTFIP